MESKKPWQSKTVWMALIVAGAAFIPAVHMWISVNPETFASIMGFVFAALRMISQGKIDIKDDPALIKGD